MRSRKWVWVWAWDQEHVPNLWRVTHHYDIVPHIPTPQQNFFHSQFEVRLPASESPAEVVRCTEADQMRHLETQRPSQRCASPTSALLLAAVALSAPVATACVKYAGCSLGVLTEAPPLGDPLADFNLGLKRSAHRLGWRTLGRCTIRTTTPITTRCARAAARTRTAPTSARTTSAAAPCPTICCISAGPSAPTSADPQSSRAHAADRSHHHHSSALSPSVAEHLSEVEGRVPGERAYIARIPACVAARATSGPPK